ncbi:MAG: calcium-binding protein [Arenibacterium sp.]
MAYLALYNPYNLLEFDVVFPNTITPIGDGFLLETRGWSFTFFVDERDIAERAILRITDGPGAPREIQLIASDIDRPIVAPIGGTVTELMRLILDQEDVIIGSPWDDITSGFAKSDVLRGQKGRDTLYGERGDDTLNGGFARDALFGGRGNDTLKGGFGNDQLSGGVGRDRLIGDEGNDVLEGGPGQDRFVFKPGSGSDVITDFQIGRDLIKFRIDSTDFSDLTLEKIGRDVLISMHDIEVTVRNTSVDELDSESNFLF